MESIELLELVEEKYKEFFVFIKEEGDTSERDDIDRWYNNKIILSVINDKKKLIREVIESNKESEHVKKILQNYVEELKEERSLYDTAILGTTLNFLREYYFDLHVSLQRRLRTKETVV